MLRSSKGDTVDEETAAAGEGQGGEEKARKLVETLLETKEAVGSTLTGN